MLYGGFENQMQVMGLLYIIENQTSENEIVTDEGSNISVLLHRSIRQQVAKRIGFFRAAFRSQAEIKLQVTALSTANQALEARVSELERQLTVVTATRT
jgi:hypothetical protein